MDQPNGQKEKNSESQVGQSPFSAGNVLSGVAQATKRKSKQDSLREKKVVKKGGQDDQPQQKSQTDGKEARDKTDDTTNVAARQAKPKKGRTMTNTEAAISSFGLERLVIHPPYVKISHGNIFTGNFGHSSVIFTRPIIEGEYFIEFIIKEDAPQEKQTRFKSSIRVGICLPTYNTVYPLGKEESIAYKSSNGGIVMDGTQVEKTRPSSINDIIGLYLKISSPHKHPSPKQKNQGSFLTIFKNGKQIYKSEYLNQVFYCFGISLYNYAQIQVYLGSKSIFQMPQNARHYFSVLDEKIRYKDLQQRKIFKI